MDANLVNVLSWTNPSKSAIILFLTNITLWFLLFQRPVTVMSLMLLIYYLRNLWIQRIRPEVLVDPPDSECWTNLASYDFEHTLVSFGKNTFNFWFTLRGENHALWTMGSCLIWLILAKIGTFFSFNTSLFLIANGAFAIGPLSKHFNLFEKVQTEEDELMIGTLDTSEGLWSPTPKEMTPPPESLTPFQSMMPSHDNNDSEEEFLFDPNHFESNSSSSSSNSFELIHF